MVLEQVTSDPNADWDSLMISAEIHGSLGEHPDDNGAVEHAVPYEELSDEPPVALAGRGTSKRGVRIPNLFALQRKYNLAKYIGSKGHKMAEQDGLSDIEIPGRIVPLFDKDGVEIAAVDGKLSEQELHYNEFNGNVPFKVMYWALLAREAFQDYFASRTTQPGMVVRRLHEVKIRLGPKERNSGVYLEENLVDEQARVAGVGPLGTVMPLNPSTLDPGQVDGQFAPMVDKLQAELPDDLTTHAEQIKTHRLGHDGKLIWCPTTDADEITLMHAEKDPYAASVSKAFGDLLDSGKLYHPEMFVQSQHTGEQGNEIDGYDIIYRAAKLIVSGRLKVKFSDYKFVSHIGHSEELEQFWDQNKGNLSSIYSNKNLRKKGTVYSEIRHELFEHEFNVAVGYLAFINALCAGLKHQYSKPDYCDETQITPDDLTEKIPVTLGIVDFNILNRGQTKLPGGLEELPYPTNLRLSEAGVPDKVTIYERLVPFNRIPGYWARWERRIYSQQLVKQLIGRRAVQKRMEDEAAALAATQPV